MHPLLQLLLVFIGLVVVLAIIRFLFENFYTSRILSLLFGGVSIYTYVCAGSGDVFWPCLVFSVLSWLFFRGEGLFDSYETGWVIIDGYGNRTIETAGGFLSHAIPATLVIGIILYFGGPNYPIVYYIIPGLIIVLDVISFFMGE